MLVDSHCDGLDEVDPYFTWPEAVHALLCLEAQYLPEIIWEPFAGDGAIVRPLTGAGPVVLAFDIHDYGLEACLFADYFETEQPPGIGALSAIRRTSGQPRSSGRRWARCRTSPSCSARTSSRPISTPTSGQLVSARPFAHRVWREQVPISIHQE